MMLIGVVDSLLRDAPDDCGLLDDAATWAPYSFNALGTGV